MTEFQPFSDKPLSRSELSQIDRASARKAQRYFIEREQQRNQKETAQFVLMTIADRAGNVLTQLDPHLRFASHIAPFRDDALEASSYTTGWALISSEYQSIDEAYITPYGALVGILKEAQEESFSVLNLDEVDEYDYAVLEDQMNDLVKTIEDISQSRIR